MLSALGAVGGSINKLPCNGGVAKTKSRWQHGGTRDILVAVVFSFRCSNIQSDAASVIRNLGGNWINLRAVNYWLRLILNLNLLSTSRYIAYTINELPSNGGITKTKSRWKIGGARDVLVAVVLRFWCSNIQSNAAGVVANLSGNWINLGTIYIICKMVGL